jgi:hypothetical protein
LSTGNQCQYNESTSNVILFFQHYFYSSLQAKIAAEIGEVISGKALPSNKFVLFKSLGMKDSVHVVVCLLCLFVLFHWRIKNHHENLFL